MYCICGGLLYLLVDYYCVAGFTFPVADYILRYLLLLGLHLLRIWFWLTFYLFVLYSWLQFLAALACGGLHCGGCGCYPFIDLTLFIVRLTLPHPSHYRHWFPHALFYAQPSPLYSLVYLAWPDILPFYIDHTLLLFTHIIPFIPVFTLLNLFVVFYIYLFVIFIIIIITHLYSHSLFVFIYYYYWHFILLLLWFPLLLLTSIICQYITLHCGICCSSWHCLPHYYFVVFVTFHCCCCSWYLLPDFVVGQIDSTVYYIVVTPLPTILLPGTLFVVIPIVVIVIHCWRFTPHIIWHDPFPRYLFTLFPFIVWLLLETTFIICICVLLFIMCHLVQAIASIIYYYWYYSSDRALLLFVIIIIVVIHYYRFILLLLILLLVFTLLLLLLYNTFVEACIVIYWLRWPLIVVVVIYIDWRCYLHCYIIYIIIITLVFTLLWYLLLLLLIVPRCVFDPDAFTAHYLAFTKAPDYSYLFGVLLLVVACVYCIYLFGLTPAPTLCILVVLKIHLLFVARPALLYYLCVYSWLLDPVIGVLYGLLLWHVCVFIEAAWPYCGLALIIVYDYLLFIIILLFVCNQPMTLAIDWYLARPADPVYYLVICVYYYWQWPGIVWYCCCLVNDALADWPPFILLVLLLVLFIIIYYFTFYYCGPNS